MAEYDLPGGIVFDSSTLGTTAESDRAITDRARRGETAEEVEPDLWQSNTLGDLGFLKPFFEASKKGLELHKQNAAFIKEVYEVNKALMLAVIDPIFAAIQAILDEILKLLQDLRGLGFFMLPVHASNVKSNVQRNPMTGSLHYGGEVYVQAKRVPEKGGELQPADIAAGDKVAKDPISGETNYIKQTVFKEITKQTAFGKQTGLAKVSDVIDKYYIQMNKWTGMLSLTPGGILQTIDDSFDDVNDIPKHLKKAIATGETDMKPEDFATNKKKTKFELLNVDPTYYQSGRPIMSDSSKVGGIIFILGMPDFNKFTTILESFNRFLDISDFQKLLDDCHKIWQGKDKGAEVLVQHVAAIKSEKMEGLLDADTPYKKGSEYSGSFRKQKVKDKRRIMCGDTGVVARVVDVKETKAMFIEDIKPAASLGADTVDALELTESRLRMKHETIKKNKNPLPYRQQILEVIYETPGSEFEKGDVIWECQPTGQLTKMDGIDSDGNTMGLKAEAEAAKSSPVGKIYGQVKPGRCVAGRVVSAFDRTASGTPPNWYGKSLEQLIPQMGPLLNRVESEVRGIKATVASARTTIDPIIKWLDDKIDDVMVFAADIEKILELFANGIPATGMYTLYLEPRAGGITKFRERMLGAGGPMKPPEELKFCAGVCFLGGGPDGNPLLKSLDMLSLLLGLRVKTEKEQEQVAKFVELATPPFNEDKVYQSGDKVFYKGANYECIGTDVSGELPLIKDPIVNMDTGLPSGELILNVTYWKHAAADAGPDEQVTVGDTREPSAIKAAKLVWLKSAKERLGKILVALDGESSGQNLRKKINQVSLYGSVDIATGKFTGENKNVYIELKQLRDSDINELELLVARINELLSAIEIALIQASPDTSQVPAPVGAIRTKGKSLLMINGEMVDFVDDFDAGQRRIRENTTITIMDPSMDISGQTRSVEKLSNTTVAILEEAFGQPPDIEENIDIALTYDVKLRYDQWPTEYANDPANKANNTHYIHPGYRLREFSAKANTISVVMPDASSGKYPTVPVWESGQAGPQGAIRTSSFYPDGTIIKLNGTVPTSAGFVQGGGVEVLGTEADPAATWMGLGVSTDDELIVNFGTEKGKHSRTTLETIGGEYLALDAPYRVGTGAIEQFLYHDDWEIKVSDLSQAEALKKKKIQDSRNKFLTYLKTINEYADTVYDDLTTLEDEGW